MGEGGLPMPPPGNNPPRDIHGRPIRAVAEHGLRLRRGVLAIEAISVRRDSRRLQGFEFFASRLENEVQFFGHAAAVVDPPPCFRYASMNGSMAPSITFWTSGILSSVRWSLTIVYGWNT